MTGNFNQGRSVGEREGIPAYGDANEAYRVSGGVDQYVGAAGLLPPESGTRNQPIRGAGSDVKRRPGSHGMELEIKGTDVILGPNNFEVQDLVLERMAQHACVAQYQHAEWVRRGMVDKQDFPDGTGRPSGKIKAVHSFGLGDAYARPGPSGHDPGDDDNVTGDYLRHGQDPLAKYGDGVLSARSVLGPGQDYGSGYAKEYQGSSFPTMGDSILEGVIARSELIATSRIPTTKPAATRSNRMLGQQQRKAR